MWQHEVVHHALVESRGEDAECELGESCVVECFSESEVDVAGTVDDDVLHLGHASSDIMLEDDLRLVVVVGAGDEVERRRQAQVALIVALLHGDGQHVACDELRVGALGVGRCVDGHVALVVAQVVADLGGRDAGFGVVVVVVAVEVAQLVEVALAGSGVHADGSDDLGAVASVVAEGTGVEPRGDSRPGSVPREGAVAEHP